MMLCVLGLFRVWKSCSYSREVGLFGDLEWRAFMDTMARLMKIRTDREAYADLRNQFSPRLQAMSDPLQEG